MDFSRFEVLSFDCYGTLVDWERGILGALQPVLAAHKVRWDADRVLEEYAKAEAELEAGPYMRYADVLRGVMERVLRAAKLTADAGERQVLVHSHPYWKPFPDTVDALRELEKRFKLVIISNVDDDLWPATEKQLGVTFHAVITAQQVGSYKPSHANFRAAFERVGAPVDRWLHVAQSTWHDIRPARELGVHSVWVNRRHDKERPGASLACDAVPDVEVPDLETLAKLAR